MAVPCAYLQRHALELACKLITEWAYRIRAQNETIKTRLQTGALDVVTPRESPTGHDLKKLAEDMSAALVDIGFESPPAMLSLIDEMDLFEDGDPTRLRYPSGSRKGNYSAESFPNPVIVPVVEWQQRLDQLECEVLVLKVDYDESPGTFCDRLYMEDWANREQLFELEP